MSLSEEDLAATVELLRHPLLARDQVRAHARALAWMRANREELERAGWSVERLFHIGTLAYPYSDWGPGWLTLWNNEKCEPRLDGRGNLEFVLHEAGGDVVQTCWIKTPFLV